jgi:hypothetical protein
MQDVCHCTRACPLLPGYSGSTAAGSPPHGASWRARPEDCGSRPRARRLAAMRFGIKLVVPLVMLSLSVAKVDYKEWAKPIFFFFMSSLTLVRAAQRAAHRGAGARMPLVPWAPRPVRRARADARGALGARRRPTWGCTCSSRASPPRTSARAPCAPPTPRASRRRRRSWTMTTRRRARCSCRRWWCAPARAALLNAAPSRRAQALAALAAALNPFRRGRDGRGAVHASGARRTHRAHAPGARRRQQLAARSLAAAPCGGSRRARCRRSRAATRPHAPPEPHAAAAHARRFRCRAT